MLACTKPECRGILCPPSVLVSFSATQKINRTLSQIHGIFDDGGQNLRSGAVLGKARIKALQVTIGGVPFEERVETCDDAILKAQGIQPEYAFCQQPWGYAPVKLADRVIQQRTGATGLRPARAMQTEERSQQFI